MAICSISITNGKMFCPLKPLSTSTRIISVNGKIIYNDQRRRIDLKKPIRDLFEGNETEVHYIMELCLSKEKAMERVSKLAENNVLPVLLYFSMEDKDANMP